MPIYTFSAKDNLGAPKIGTVEANDKDSALNLLKNRKKRTKNIELLI
jgi:hypothetical protein